MKVLVFGRDGQLARSIIRFHSDATTVGHNDIDFLSGDDVLRSVESSLADVVINTAAFTAVDRAEADFDSAHGANAVFPGILAQVCKSLDVPLLHVSCSYVFDGSLGRAYREDDQANPINAYGRTKLAGEHAVLNAGGRALVVRTSSTYSSYGALLHKWVRDSLFESIVIAGRHEQLVPYEVQDQKLAFVQHCAEAARFPIDLV